MSDRIGKIAMSSDVKNYAQGAAQENVGKLAEFIAPTVSVATTNFRYWRYDDKNRFIIPQTKRAINGTATTIKFSGVEVNAKLEPNALDYPIDEAERLSDPELKLTLQEGANAIGQVAGLAHEKEVVDAALAAAGAGTDLSAATSGMDFVHEINSRILDVAKAAKSGSLMNVKIVWGPNAFLRFIDHSSVKSRFLSGGKKQVVNPTMDDVMTLLIGNPEVQLSLSVYDAAAEGLDADINWVLDGSILIFASVQNATRVDPSFMKTFRLMGQFMVPGSYKSVDGRQEFAKYDWYCLPVVTNSVAVKRVNLTA